MPELLPEKSPENTSSDTASTQVSLCRRLLPSLILAVIITGIAFWSGYLTLRGPAGWVGERRFVAGRVSGIKENLAKYHDEHGEYPETLRDIYGKAASNESDNQETLDPEDEQYHSSITVYRHPVSYERTETGWVITDYGYDGAPGGVGINADFSCTPETCDDLDREFFRNKKYWATFEQTRAAHDGSHFRSLVLTSCIFGFAIFVFSFSLIGSRQNQHTGSVITQMIIIAVPAAIIGLAIMAAHNTATGH